MLKTYGLGIFGVIGIHASDDGHVDKSIYLFIDRNSSDELAHTYEDLLTHIEGIDDIKLDSKEYFAEKEGDQSWKYTYYKINNHSYTRKKFEAVVKAYYLGTAALK